MLPLFKKKKKEVITHDSNVCLNCNTMLNGDEKFCPNCGQKNSIDALGFKNFMGEVFQGFTSWDAKFWKTFIPLITKPGKVSRDYIEGKRMSYTNPFRFYISTSILFFLILSITNSIKNYQELTTGKSYNNKEEKSFLDGIKAGWNNYENNKKPSDTIRNAKVFGKDIISFVNLQKTNPNLPIDRALDSLGEPKTFLNRFLYKKAKTINGFTEDTDNSIRKLGEEAISYTSGAIFILLPILALFLKLFYIRNNFKYIEHLIFLFHLQTFLFILMIIFEILDICFTSYDDSIGSIIIFIIFLIYLFIAMKKFYQQNYFKTSLKFLITIITYCTTAYIGSSILMILAFIFM